MGRSDRVEIMKTDRDVIVLLLIERISPHSAAAARMLDTPRTCQLLCRHARNLSTSLLEALKTCQLLCTTA